MNNKFNPDEPDQTLLPLELLPLIARKLGENFDPVGVKAVFTSAVQNGLVSSQEISELDGGKILTSLKSKNPVPNTPTAKKFLELVMGKDPTTATGKPIPWRHEAKPRKAAGL